MAYLKRYAGITSNLTVGDTIEIESYGGHTYFMADGKILAERTTTGKSSFTLPAFKWCKWVSHQNTSKTLYTPGKGTIDAMLNYWSAPLGGTDSHIIYYNQPPSPETKPTYLEQLHKLDGKSKPQYFPKSK